VHGLVASVAVEVLDDVTSLVVSAPQVARRRPALAESVIERSEVERLRSRPAGLVGARLEADLAGTPTTAS